MIKKSKKLVVAMIALLLFVSCGANPVGSPLLSSLSQSGTCATLGIAIEGPDSALVHPGESIEFEANKKSNGWQYAWSTTPPGFTDNFSTLEGTETIFTVPDASGPVKILLTVETSSGCKEQDDFELSIVPDTFVDEAAEPIVDEVPATATVAVTATLTSMPTAEPTATPTTEPTETASPAPTPTVTETAVPTSIPLPTATPIPTINDPVITYLEFLPGGAVRIVWTWDGELSPTQNFAVRFWSVEDTRPEARFSITWTKELSYQFGVNSTDFPIGTYYINVAVMEGPSEGVHYELARSEDLPIFVNPQPIPPTPPIP